jgi:pimeloyl-ACP methyl ester carboxylesterase
MATSYTVRTSTLDIGYEAYGDTAGFPIVLLHGFPDDARAWDTVAPPLAAAGYRVLVPYLRGYGPTRFLDPAAPRMAQQAAIAQDLLDFMNALSLEHVALSGYDWGGRAACISAILAPERVRALVTIGGYNVQNTLASPPPASAEEERAHWYQWYFNTERGRVGLEQQRRAICRLLWQEWSPNWHFDDATFERTALSFDHPDFVPVVIHSYRHRHGNAAGTAAGNRGRPTHPAGAQATVLDSKLTPRPVTKIPLLLGSGSASRGTAGLPCTRSTPIPQNPGHDGYLDGSAASNLGDRRLASAGPLDGTTCPTQPPQQREVEANLFRRLSLQGVQDFIGAERQLFEPHPDGILNRIGNGGWGAEARWFRHRSGAERPVLGGHLHQHVFNGWDVWRQRHQVGGQGRVENPSILNHHRFVERPADALHGSTLDLPFHRHRIKRHPDILGLHKAHDADRAGLPIHDDFRGLSVEHRGKGHGGQRRRAQNRAGFRREA